MKTCVHAAMAVLMLLSATAGAATTVMAASPAPVAHLTYTEVNEQYGLLVWSVKDLSGVYAQVVDRAGNTPVGEVFVLAAPNETVEDPVRGLASTLRPGSVGADPAVVADPATGTVLVAWFAQIQGISGYEVVGRTVSVDALGGHGLSTVYRLSHADDDSSTSRGARSSPLGNDPLAAAFNPGANEFLVAWSGTHDNDENRQHLFAQRVALDGSVLTDESVTAFNAHGSTFSSAIDLLYLPERGEYLLVWAERLGSKHVSAKYLSPDLNVDPQAETVLWSVQGNGVGALKLAKGVADDRFLLVFEEGGGDDLQGRWLSDGLQPLAEAFDIHTSDKIGNLVQPSLRVVDEWLAVQYVFVTEARAEMAFLRLDGSVEQAPEIARREAVALTVTSPPDDQRDRLQALGLNADGAPVTFAIDATDATRILAAVPDSATAADLSLSLPEALSLPAGAPIEITVPVTLRTPGADELPPGYASTDSVTDAVIVLETYNSDVFIEGADANAGDCERNGGRTTCSLAEVRADEPLAVAVRVNSDELPPQGKGWAVLLDARVESSTVMEVASANNATRSVISLQFADIAFGELPAASVEVGESSEMAFEVHNHLNIDAVNVRLLLELPQGVKLIAAEGCSPEGETGSVTCSIGTLSNGAVAAVSLTLASAASEAQSADLVARLVTDTSETDLENNEAVIPLELLAAPVTDPPEDGDKTPRKSGGGASGVMLLLLLAPFAFRRRRGI